MKKFIQSLVLTACLFTIALVPASAEPDVIGQLTRVSISSASTQANSFSYLSAISSNGRYVAFFSMATNLVSGDTNGVGDVFVRDRLTGETTLISVSSTGEQGNGESGQNFGLAISADGRFIAFPSVATNLVPGDTNASRDVFVRDTLTGETQLVSISSSGSIGNQASAGNFGISISADGSLIAFESMAANLVQNDTNLVTDIFLHALLTGETTRLSVATDGTPGDRLSTSPALSSNGCVLAFSSDSKNLVPGLSSYATRIYIHDCSTNETTLGTRSTSGTPSTGRYPVISGDGRFIAFTSSAADLVIGDTNGQSDLFLYDRLTEVTIRVSVSSTGAQANDQTSYPASLSEDGRYIVYESWASNLASGDTNGKRDVFLYDQETAETTRLSLSSTGVQGNGVSAYPKISSDGRFVTFSGDASNLVPGDTNNWDDVFVRDRGPESYFVDLSISLYDSPTEIEKMSYESILGFFSDTVYEMSNGAHKIRTITIYQDGEQAASSNIQWLASEWPSASPSGYGHKGAFVHFGDSFLTTDFLQPDGQARGGYTLGHEWGHYYYGLYDEYVGGDASRNGIHYQPHTTDIAVPFSVMNSQWNASGGNYSWLNFSVSTNTLNTQGKTAQDRVYGASGWETLARPLSQDPPLPELFAFYPRKYYQEMAAVAPGSTYEPSIELSTVPTGITRSDLSITWVPPAAGAPDLIRAGSYIGFVEALPGNTVSFPEPLLVIGRVVKAGDGIAGAGLQASALFPDTRTVVLDLLDNGIAPDAMAADGLYSGYLPYDQDGVYSISISFDNLAGEAVFTEAGTLHSLGPNGETYIETPVPVGENFSILANLDVLVNGCQADDHGDLPAEATLLSTTGPGLFGRINRAGDRDVFEIVPSTSGELVLRVTELGLGMQPDIRLLAADGTSIIGDFPYDPVRQAYFFTAYQATAAETLYVEITHHDTSVANGIYRISAGDRLSSSPEIIRKVFIPLVIH